MAYDHNEKAGNQGDVVKHIALLAAIDSILTHTKFSRFRYCDTFAGYACSQIVHGNGWKDGIGQLFNSVSPERRMCICEDLNGNKHVELFRDLYLSGRPSLVGSVYPGSSLIVHDLCLLHRVQPEFSLWDISPSAIASLMTTYSGMEHAINPRPALHNEPSIEAADFLFIDPPKAPISKSDGLCWSEMIQFVKPQHRNVMFWLPIDFRKSKGLMIENTKAQREEAVRKGLDVLQVRWKTNENSIKTVGCQLFYRLDDLAKTSLESAIERICRVLNWQIETHSTGSQSNKIQQ